MRVLSAILHFAEQILFGDDEQISALQREKAREELRPLAQKYLQFWAGGIEPQAYYSGNDLYTKTIYNLFAAVTKTNVHLDEEVASFRFDGSILDGHQYPKRPYAIFYLWNDQFFGYHIRFQEIARGGLRTVVPRNADQEDQDRNQIFCECYELAYTQEWKNKDIPEGGAKGVLFVSSRESENLEHIQKKFIRSFLSLLVTGKTEMIFLGPDERMSDDMLDWIGDYSKQVGYTLGAAFISSRPDSGINHKLYGVTSYGLMVYIEDALKVLGIDPASMPFTVKLSGGPDGDVAGNALKMLSEKFRETARVIAIKDISGIAYDPEGIPFEAILPLVEQGLPIASIDCTLMHPGSSLLDMRKNGCRFIESQKEQILEKAHAETLFDTFLHQVPADLFLPAGGRRSSLRMENVTDCIVHGKPNIRLIVEGANVYITQEARDVLESFDVLIVKDSTANKGGVICSSFEIQALLTIGETLLVENKAVIVKEILHKIAQACRYEAQLLFKEMKLQKQPCSHLSSEISIAIEALTAQILEWLKKWESPRYWECIDCHFLPTIRSLAEEKIRQLPKAYLDACAACFIASRFVYRYGLRFPYEVLEVRLDQMTKDALEFEKSSLFPLF